MQMHTRGCIGADAHAWPRRALPVETRAERSSPELGGCSFLSLATPHLTGWGRKVVVSVPGRVLAQLRAPGAGSQLLPLS